ncbi:hypothetical protein FOPE_00006 [Fonsecaea pedrosoi]|nr:hypothetical protein FOPE_00006 [Fonsecaea pedrosoi]
MSTPRRRGGRQQTPSTPSRRMTRQTAQDLQQNPDQEPQSQALITALNTLNITQDTSLQNVCDQRSLREWALSPNPVQALNRVTSLFEEYLRHQDDFQELAHIFVETFEGQQQFDRIISGSETLRELYARVNITAKRHRDTLELIKGAKNITREELGSDFFDSYEANMGKNKTQWDVIRRLIRFAQENNLQFLATWRLAWSEALHRINGPGKKGMSRVPAITNSDLEKVKKKVIETNPPILDATITRGMLPNSTWSLDAYGIPWHKTTPNKMIELRKPLPLPWDESRKRKRGQRSSGGGGGGTRQKIPGVSTDTLFGDPDSDPFLDSRNIQRNIFELKEYDPQTGNTKTVTRLNALGTPARTVRQLASGWRTGSPVLVPIGPMKPPQYNTWYQDLDKFGELEKALLTYHFHFTQWLAGKEPAPPNPFHSPAIAEAAASPTMLEDALQNLRRLAKYRPPQRPGDNPYTMQDNQQAWWVFGLIQWLAGQQFGRMVQEPPWVSTARGIIRTIQQSWPSVQSDFTRLNLTPNASVYASSFDSNHWLLDAAGQFDGWATDDIVMGAIIYYARNFRDVEVIDSSAFTAFETRIRGEREDFAAAPAIEPGSRLVVVPIHIHSNHWILGVIDMAEHWLTIIDTMHIESDTQILRHLLQENGIDPDDYQDHTFDNVPRQRNVSDCGYWVIANARGMMERRSPATDTTTGLLRLEILGDLFRALQTYNPNLEFSHEIARPTRLMRGLFRENIQRGVEKVGLRYRLTSSQLLQLSSTFGGQKMNLTDIDQAIKEAVEKVKAREGKEYKIKLKCTTIKGQEYLRKIEEENDMKRLKQQADAEQSRNEEEEKVKEGMKVILDGLKKKANEDKGKSKAEDPKGKSPK